MTTGSRESGANLSTRCSGTFAEDGSGGSSRSSSDFGMCCIISLRANSGEPGHKTEIALILSDAA
jgi:hypothetical protein